MARLFLLNALDDRWEAARNLAMSRRPAPRCIGYLVRFCELCYVVCSLYVFMIAPRRVGLHVSVCTYIAYVAVRCLCMLPMSVYGMLRMLPTISVYVVYVAYVAYVVHVLHVWFWKHPEAFRKREQRPSKSPTSAVQPPP